LTLLTRAAAGVPDCRRTLAWGWLREGPIRPERGEPGRRPWHRGTGHPGGPIFNVSPVVLWLVIANLAIHLALTLAPGEAEGWVYYYGGLVSARLTGGQAWGPLDPLTLLTYQFLHGGLEHLIINMLALLAFGVGLERWLGPWRFLALYLLCGVAGGVAQLIAFPNSPGPLIGASGAISGCFAAILRLMAAVAEERTGRNGMQQIGLIAAIWIGSQLAFGLVGGETTLGMVAWWTHIGGFLAGLLLVGFLRPRYRNGRV